MRRILLAAATAALVSGCSVLPEVGPKADVVMEEAGAAQPRFAAVTVTDQVVAIARRRAADASLTGFGAYRGGQAFDTRVGVGDAVVLTIWEAGSGGLFSSGVSATPGAAPSSRAAGVPEQIIGRDGMISVPYVGRVRAAGRSTSEIQREIERGLEGKAIQPQALVTVSRPSSNLVTVIGDATTGGRVSLSPRGDRVLDVIASAGGIKTPINETFVQVSRGGRTARAAFSRVAANTHENIFVRPGDVVSVIRDPQVFFAYGATGRNAEINFDAEGVTLAQALSKAGGLLDFRSDPEGVFVFRLETPEIARALPNGAASLEGGRAKVVYRFDFRDPNSLFLASKFPIFKNDLVYVSDSKFTDLQKIMTLFNLVASPVATGARTASAVGQ